MEILKVVSQNNEPIPVDYAIYPSLLDAYLRYKKNDDDETFDSLFDKINKVRSDQTEFQQKGSEFEGLVNDAINKDPLTIAVDDRHYATEHFNFKIEIIEKLKRKLIHATEKQKYMEVIIHTHMGNIKLYGIVDYDFPDMIVDLKGTENYKCNKYEDSTQHPVYSLIRHLNGRPIKGFKYLVSDYDKVFQETYIPSDNMFIKLILTIFEFINFINHFKLNITDEKIFGGKKESVTAPVEVSEIR